MRIVDVNLLLYALNRDAPQHPAAKAWLERTLTDGETVVFAWVVILGFLRLSTHPRVFPRPLEPHEALAVVDGWLSRASVQVVDPGQDHWRRLKELLGEAGAAGNLTTDAHLAAIAVEHGAELSSTDADFARFPHLRWVNPIQPTRSQGTPPG